ncbi:AAA family ATPase [Methylobacterium sp. Leaf456]|uniref:ParA family protein n=1 Tax=Methylobacterium sp. Leaf456 TaxID=1736382 RepID=UPI001910D0B4|nr:AAA family ATPase [Methylobacterium sp. Leaf456]
MPIFIPHPIASTTCTFLLNQHHLHIFARTEPPALLCLTSTTCKFTLRGTTSVLGSAAEGHVMSSLEKVLETHSKVVEDGHVQTGELKYRSYAVSTLRGGVGKSTIAFNFAYELSIQRPLLLADMCAQCNLTENLMRDQDPEITVLDTLQPILLGPAFGSIPHDASYRVSKYCDPFKMTKPSYLMPGNAELFAFPSMLYQQLQTAHSQGNKKAVKALLESLRTILDKEAKDKHSEGILMDTSPFYAGGTHIAWAAADAIIIPVRVDEHSID